MSETGSSHGSITVINAMPCGIEATIRVDLKMTAKFDECDESRTVRINNNVSDDMNWLAST